ncbi:MAG: DUF3857 domain-containing protein [Acidobacteriota bacterium]
MFLALDATAQDWRPVDPAHLAMKEPVVEKDADAEAIFWEVRVNDAGYDLVFNHYVRIKIFTERGKESESKIDIPYIGNFQIKDIAARTIKPDGSIVELKKESVFDRTIIKVSGIKVKAKSFAMPTVEPGVIIEYRWKEVRPFRSADNIRLPFQRDIPVQFVKYFIKPDPNRNDLAGMRTLAFRMPRVPFTKEKDGFYSMQMTNVPAFREEPYMPPEDQVRSWMLIFYSQEDNLDSAKYWGTLGKRVAEYMKPQMKVNDEIKKAVPQIIGDATTPEDKLARILNFVRTQIKNTSDDASGMTDEQRKKLKNNNSPSDTLKRGMGDGSDIDFLFAALATAAGFDARLALLPDRGDIFFDPKLPVPYFIETGNIAVKVGEGWKFFDPSTTYVPNGMLRWQQEGVQALILDTKECVFVPTPMSPPERSKETRTATFKLSEDGTLEGDVRMVYTGHRAYERKESNDDETPEKREEALRDMIQSRLSTAELSNIIISSVTDPVKPFVYTFHVKVPGYAQRTGKRLFFQPAFFERGIGERFPNSARQHAIYFHYPWMEEDVVTIELPPGYALDSADQPQGLKVENVGSYDVSIGVTKDGRMVEYRRKFQFGLSDNIYFQSSNYPTLKQVFNMVHDRDNHTLTLKQDAAK